MKKYAMYIDGKFIQAGNKRTMDIFDPAKGKVMAKVPEATRKDMETAIRAARRAFDTGAWRQSTGMSRSRVLLRIADGIRKNAAMLAELETRNMGKPLAESEFDVADAATCFEYFAGFATKIFGETNPVPDNALSITVKEPVGVAGLIIPWNYPLLMAAWKLGPALAAGCTTILKPAEQTPLTVLELARMLDEIVELPKGVVNIVPGPSEVVGACLAESNEVDKVAFTGSTDVGRLILQASAKSNIKKVTLELGGKSPNIFFADADFTPAVEGALFGGFVNQGEVCSAGSRILVQNKIHDAFVEAMIKKTKSIQIGSGMDRANKLGPLVTLEHMERVLSFIAKGKKEGARLAYGGRRIKDGPLGKGYFVEPTIFTEVTNGMTIAREEIFGPVLSVIRFEDEEEAIRIANDTPYGLAGAVWTRDIFKAFRVVKAVKAGTMWINHMQPCFVEAPWGGFKQSGIGRELGKYGVENFLETKLIHVNLSEAPIGWY